MSAGTSYDRDVLLTHTAGLYRRANAGIVLWILALAFGACIAATVAHLDSPMAAAVAGAVAGAWIGAERAFRLKLIAQQMLCQIEIERHLARIAPAGALPEQTPQS